MGRSIGRREVDVSGRVTLGALQRMKRDGRKIVGVVLYDFQMAQIADRAGVDLVSAGDSVGVNLWGHVSEAEVTLDQMVLVCRAVRRGVARALVSCDVPIASLRAGTSAAVEAATRLTNDGGADLVKVDAAASSLDAIGAITRAGIPVWAQFGTDSAAAIADRLVRDATALEESGAALLDFRHSGPVAGPAVVDAVAIPVLGGLGGGPWLDGRIRAIVSAIGYLASAVGDTVDRYANVADAAHSALTTLCDDVRAGRPLKGEPAR
jgi:3-methyl-2-oxobutanoate hydroxymethyltransferase